MKSNALKIDKSDNVAIATQSIKKGDQVVVSGEILCKAVEDIEMGQGEWVHVHNTQPIPGDLKE